MMPMMRFLKTVTTFSTPMPTPLTMFCMEGIRVFLIQLSRSTEMAL